MKQRCWTVRDWEERDKNDFLASLHEVWCKISVLLLKEACCKELPVSPSHSWEPGVQRRSIIRSSTARMAPHKIKVSKVNLHLKLPVQRFWVHAVA